MIIEAILKINPKAVVSVSGDKLDTCTIEWLEGTTEISKADIQAKINETQYQKDRAVAYPSLKEFAEAYCEKEIGGNSTKWNEYVTKYNKVRTDNPKE